MKKLFFVLAAAVCLSGCAAGIKALAPVPRDAKIAVVQFEECETSQVNNCKGSGAIATQAYASALGATVLAAESVPEAKQYDLLVTGKVLKYNIGTPVVGRVNYAQVEVAVKRAKDGVVVMTQEEKNDASPTYGKKTAELVEGFAEDLRQSLR